MKIIRGSSLGEYAHLFWKRQRAKKNPQDRDALADIEKGGDPLRWLVDIYPYKLPHPCNRAVRLARLDQEEVESLLVHDYMPRDRWMQDRGVVPEPYTRRLKNLANTFIQRGYFDICWDDKQQIYYREWKAKGSLENVFNESEKTLIECVQSGDYEIIDGWGRLLPFVALLQQGYQFYPVECFVASKTGVDIRTRTRRYQKKPLA
jgi:hypothetical protein